MKNLMMNKIFMTLMFLSIISCSTQKKDDQEFLDQVKGKGIFQMQDDGTGVETEVNPFNFSSDGKELKNTYISEGAFNPIFSKSLGDSKGLYLATLTNKSTGEKFTTYMAICYDGDKSKMSNGETEDEASNFDTAATIDIR